MPYLVEQLITADVGQRGIQLGSEELLRQWSFGTNWTKVRIGIRLCSNASGATVLQTLGIGVTQGLQGYVGAPTDLLMVVLGTTTNIINGVNWRINTPSRPFYVDTVTTGYTVFRKQGSTTTQLGTAASNIGSIVAQYALDTPTYHRSQIFLEITKGNPNYSYHVLMPISQANAQTPINRNTFYQNLEAASPSACGLLAGSPLSVAYTGSGLFDTAFIFSNKPTPTFEINDWAVLRYT